MIALQHGLSQHLHQAEKNETNRSPNNPNYEIQTGMLVEENSSDGMPSDINNLGLSVQTLD